MSVAIVKRGGICMSCLREPSCTQRESAFPNVLWTREDEATLAAELAQKRLKRIEHWEKRRYAL